jgi:hypothetical protein
MNKNKFFEDGDALAGAKAILFWGFVGTVFWLLVGYLIIN